MRTKNDLSTSQASSLTLQTLQDLDIAILKATNHDEVVPKEKHCRSALLLFMKSCQPHSGFSPDLSIFTQRV